MIANLVAGFLGVGGGVATDYESIATAREVVLPLGSQLQTRLGETR